MEIYKLDLKDYIESKKVLAGRTNGEDIRKKINLEKIENENKKIEIIIPNDVFSFNSSYFLGMFGESVKKLGKEKFEEKYQFNTKNESIRMNIKDGIDEALNNVDVFGG